MTLLVTLLTVAVAILTVLVVGLLRANGAILRHLHEHGLGLDATLDPGAPSPLVNPDAGTDRREAADIVGVTPTGDTVAVNVVGARHDTVLLFLSSGCGTCQPFWEALGRPGGVSLAGGTRLVVVTQGPESESPGEVARLAPSGVTVVMSSAAWRDHDVPGSPFVALVDARTGRVRGSGTGEDWDEVAALLQVAEGDARGVRQPRGPRAAADARREQELDALLLSAGIEPGDPSLYPPDGSADGPVT